MKKLLELINKVGQHLTNHFFHGKIEINFSAGKVTHYTVTESFKA